MKFNKLFIGFGTVLICLFLIFSNVLAAPSDKEGIQKEPKKWELKNQDLKPGGKPKPKKNLKPKIQKHDSDQPFTQDDSDLGKRKARPEKADSIQ